jgi:hypothetical protein
MSVITTSEVVPSSLPARRSLLRRFFDHIVAAQQARAEAELKRHSHLLPRELDQVTWKLGERSEDSLPFIR